MYNGKKAILLVCFYKFTKEPFLGICYFYVMALRYLTDRITVDEGICNGKPTIRGLRLTVQTILEYLAAGDSPSNILEAYPFLEQADIDASLKFAAEMLSHSYTIKDVA
jgi:uncharacterized protein (DUF433 family)